MPRYYRFGGLPKYYPINWDGRGHGGTRAATTRALGEARWEEDLSTGAKWEVFGNDSGDPDAIYDTPAGRPTNGAPEPLDPSMIPPFQRPGPMGAFQLSDNEKRLALVAAAGAAAWWFFLRKPKKGRRR